MIAASLPDCTVTPWMRSDTLTIELSGANIADEPDGAPPVRRRKPTAPGLHDLAERLSDRLETRVKVDLGQRKGKITVEFASLDDLRRIVDIMDPRNRSDKPI